ncbi:MAG: sugar phosphate isomerase/epimerase [Oscillospiraceae bacterium]|nr:sugar phosphate isomerase/epimerase [Oscillospiraceae bacterium]
MKLGFLTVCLGSMPLREKAEFAAKTGFKALEVAAWPKLNDRDYSSADIDAANLTQQEADEIREYMSGLGLEISSLAYYDNNLHPDKERREYIHNHLRKVIDAAAMLNVEMAGTFAGRNFKADYDQNLEEFAEVFGKHIEYAKSKNVKIIIENCHMPNWHGDGKPGTISHTPEQFRNMFAKANSDFFGLNFDPSHFVPQYIDYSRALNEFMGKTFHFHAKDCEILPEKLYEKGANLRGYWRYRMPGLGQIDWKEIIAQLKKAGYDGVISIEHEDMLYEGNVEKVKEGLKIGFDYLNRLTLTF